MLSWCWTKRITNLLCISRRSAKWKYSRSLDYLRQGASVIVLRTFSKAHGLAGLRVGYGLGPAELLAYCARMRNTYSVSSVAQVAALAALDDRNHIERVVSNNAAQAQVLGVGLSELGYRVVPTAANFLYCDVGDAADLPGGCVARESVSAPWEFGARRIACA